MNRHDKYTKNVHSFIGLSGSIPDSKDTGEP